MVTAFAFYILHFAFYILHFNFLSFVSLYLKNKYDAPGPDQKFAAFYQNLA